MIPCLLVAPNMAAVVQNYSASNPNIKANNKADPQKPQVNFKEKIDNDPQPFLHKLKEKPHSLSALSLQHHDSHPYEFELQNFTPDPIFLAVKNDVPSFQPLSKTPLIMVDSNEGFEHLLQDLLLQTVIAVDLEHHDARSYQGITCLIQISTVKSDYIIDTLKLWDHLQPLNQVFCNPNILKIFQAADNDVLWLQRDFGIYVVNLFDTCQAASILGLESRGLEFLLKHYCRIRISKCYQRADWRIRPLPLAMLDYARGDAHYLIYIYERLKQDLSSQSPAKLQSFIGKEGSPKECQELKTSKPSQVTPVETCTNPIMKVWKNSQSICLKRYRVPPSERYLKVYNKLIQKEKNLNKQQLYALKELCAWRDRVAREEDESPNFVVPNYMLVRIIYLPIKEPQHLLHCCSHAPFVQQHLVHLHGIMLKAEELDFSCSDTKETKTTRKTKQRKNKGRGNKQKTADAATPVSRHAKKKRVIEYVSSKDMGSIPVRKTSRVEMTVPTCDTKSHAETGKHKPSKNKII